MASSSGKPTAVHFSLIIFVMLTIIVGVIAFLSFKDAGEKTKELTAAKESLTKQKALASDYLDDITAMKKRLGHIHENVGREFGPNGATESHGRGHIEDVDNDGDDDLVLHFRTRETGIAKGDTDACLVGKTFGGDDIAGCDAIRTVGK